MAIWDKAGVDAVESREQYQLSCGYRYDADMRPGRTPDGVPYDGKMVNIRGNHVALVENGRAGDDVVVGDSMEKVSMATRAKLSRTAAAVHGALSVHFKPKLAKDAKLDLGSVLVGVTAKNYLSRKPGIAMALDGALKGKLASDAEAGEIVRAAGKLLDLFEPDAEGMDDEVEAPAGMDKEAWDDEDDKALEAMQARKKAAMDKQGRDSEESGEDKKKREEEEKKKAAEDAEATRGGVESPVTKAAMDAALAKMAKDSALAVRNAEAATIKRMNDIAEAKSLVEPLVGKIAVAMDSAETVYAAALKSLGIGADGINLVGMKALIERELAHKITTSRPVRIAQDSIARNERQTAEAALGIATKRARHV